MLLFLEGSDAAQLLADNKMIIIIAAVAVVAIALFLYFKTCVVIVKQGTKKVVERFGVYHKTLNEGFHLILKPFDKIAPVPWQVLSKGQKDVLDLAARDSYNKIRNDEFMAKMRDFKRIEKKLNLEKEDKIRNLSVSSGKFYSTIGNEYYENNRNREDSYYKDFDRSNGMDRHTETEIDKAKVSDSLKSSIKTISKLSPTAIANLSSVQGIIPSYSEGDRGRYIDVETDRNRARNVSRGKDGNRYSSNFDGNNEMVANNNYEQTVYQIEKYYNSLIEAKRDELLGSFEDYRYLSDEDADRIATHEAMYGVSKFDFSLRSDDILDYVDMRERFIESNPQKVITRDNATFNVDTCIFFCVTNVFDYYYGANEPETAIKLLAITTLRNIIGSMTLEEALVSRQSINEAIRKTLDEVTNPWGIKVNRVEIKEFILSREIEMAMNSVLISEREKRSSILYAEAQARHIELLREAEAKGYEMIKAAGLDESVLMVRGYEALRDVANGQATKIYLPNNLENLVAGSNIFADALNDKNNPKVDSENGSPKVGEN